MQHGLLDGGFTFLILAEDSLPKKLCEEGYIVSIDGGSSTWMRDSNWTRATHNIGTGKHTIQWNTYSGLQYWR